MYTCATIKMQHNLILIVIRCLGVIIMPGSISKKSEDMSYRKLLVAGLTQSQKNWLRLVNSRAAEAGFMLSEQHVEVIKTLYILLAKAKDDKTAVNFVFAGIQAEREHQSKLGAVLYGQGDFTNEPIHVRTMQDELQDHDITRLLPKSTGHIEILAAVNCVDPRSTEAVNIGVQAALKNPNLQTICIPVGPGHWRGLYLSKPQKPNGEYRVELFDPMGKNNAEEIKAFSMKLLVDAGIPENKIVFTLTGPLHPQRDLYACGDFVCAKTHQKMQELGAPPEAYRQNLIDVLITSGNNGGLLRTVIRQESERLSAGDKPTKLEFDNNDYERSAPPKRAQLSSERDKKTPTRQQTTQELQDKFLSFKKEIIEKRKLIFKLADAADSKFRSGKPITMTEADADLAAKLQAEELKNAGYKS